MPDVKPLFDGVSAVVRGMNGSSSPLLVPVEQYTAGVDCTIRSEHLSPRPGWRLVARSLAGEPGAAVAAGRFQDAAFYRGVGTMDDRLVIVAGGRIFDVAPPNWTVREYVRPDGHTWFHPDAEQAYMLQVEKYVVIQDGIHRPVIYEPGKVRNAGDKEVRTGTVMAYVNGRLWTVLRDGRSFVAGDIARGPSGTPGERYLDAVLKMTENEFLAEGGSFAVPDGSGVITAMAVPAQDGTAPGTGFIVIFTTDGAYQLSLPVDRDSWKNMRSPAVARIQANRGCVGPDAFALVNGDVVFRATDGVRSLKLARRNFEASWINSAISHEVEPILELDNPRLLYGASAVEHERRWLMTCWGRPGGNAGTVYDGILSLQLDPISAMFSDDAPAWEGVWTGLRTHKLVNAQIDGKDELIAVVRTEDGGLGVMQLAEGGSTDSVPVSRPIDWSFESREMFAENAMVLKRLEMLEMELFDVRSDVDVDVFLRAASFGDWVKWGTFAVRAETGVCVDGCAPFITGNAQARSELRLGTPPDDCVDSWGKPLHTGYTWTIRCELKGFARVRALRVRAMPWTKQVTVECARETVARREDYCARNDRDNRII